MKERRKSLKGAGANSNKANHEVHGGKQQKGLPSHVPPSELKQERGGRPKSAGLHDAQLASPFAASTALPFVLGIGLLAAVRVHIERRRGSGGLRSASVRHIGVELLQTVLEVCYSAQFGETATKFHTAIWICIRQEISCCFESPEI